MYCISDRSDVCEDCECEWDADDGEEEAEDAAASRARRDVTVTCGDAIWLLMKRLRDTLK